MFGWRKEITNLECDIITTEGLLSGLNYRLNSLIEVGNNPEYRGDLSGEIKRVRLEILKNYKKLRDLKSRLNPPTIG